MPLPLSVCTIVRNEQRNLPRALASVRDIAAEVVVVDTGSTDDTVEIARQAGVKLGYFPWCDDFSAARNAALNLAEQPWILWLDADEELLDSSFGQLQSAIAADDVLAWLVVRQDLTSKTDPERFTQMWQLRLFRNRPELRFQGRCHPHFHPPIETSAANVGQRIGRSKITLRHYGYTAALRPAKMERAARLIDLELRDRPGQFYYLVEQYRTLLQLGRAEEAGRAMVAASAVLRPHLHDERSPQTLACELLETLLQLPAGDLPEGFTPLSVRRAAERWYPTAPPLVWLLAQQDFVAGRFPAAEQRLRQLLDLGRSHEYDGTVSFDPRIVNEDAALNLGVCLIRQGKLKQAAAVLRQLQSHPTRGEAARANLAAIKMTQ